MGVAMSTGIHIPVLLKESLEALAVQPGGRYIDCTLGAGGHAAAILKHGSPGGQLLGIDADPDAIEAARKRLEKHSNSILIVNDNFTNLKNICIKYDFFPVHGILFDLGLSSLQLNGSGRGFSFQHETSLDMRFNPNQDITASDIINTYSETEIARIIREYGEETGSRVIARYIVNERPISTTIELAEVVTRALKGRRGRIHPATRTFQALRIAVNHELENLESALKQAVELLGYSGRLVVISYHSLEDRIVKQFMQRESRRCICPPGTPICICQHTPRLRLINRKIVVPSYDEIERNPRSRSAKLRVAECITAPSGQYNSVIEEINSSIGAETRVWRRPALAQKLRSTFLAIQADDFRYVKTGRFVM